MASEAVMVTPLPANRALFIAFAGGGGEAVNAEGETDHS